MEQDIRAKLWNVWHARWLAADYSWKGLAKQTVDGDGGLWGEKNLQDYWRRDPETGKIRSDAEMIDAGELVWDYDETLWHIVHAPMDAGDDGGHWPRPKRIWRDDEWQRVFRCVRQRLEIAGLNTVGALDDEEGRDGRAQLQGAILSTFIHDGQPDTGFWYAAFDNARFTGRTEIRDQTFGSTTIFDGALFDEFTRFEDSRFMGWSSFSGMAFLSHAVFNNCAFLGPTQFDKTDFAGDAHFERAVFADRADFRACRFNGRAEFAGARFGEHGLFSDAAFGKRTSFARTIWAKESEFHGAKLHVDTTFDQARFRFLDQVRVSVGAVTLVLCAAFGIATLIAFRSPTMSAQMIAAIFGTALLTWCVGRPHVQFPIERYFQRTQLEPFFPNDDTLERLMRGYRTLTLLCEAVRNKRDAARFYRLELIAMRLRAGNAIERFVSWLYGWVSDYGESIWRPLLFALCLTLGFAAVYGTWDAGTLGSSTPMTEFLDASEFAASRTFPLGSWGDNQPVGTCDFRARVLAQGACRPTVLGPKSTAPQISAYRLLARTVATLHSIFVVMLLFLFGLAVRRRFQMN